MIPQEVKMVLGSTFTLALMEDMTMPLHTEKATWSDVKSLADVFIAMGAEELDEHFVVLGHYIKVEGLIGVDEIDISFQVYGTPYHLVFLNSFGHASTTKVIEKEQKIHIRAHRTTLCLDEGWTIVIPQYRGERLAEGVIDLPEDAELVPIKVILGEDEEKIALRKKVAMLERKVALLEGIVESQRQWIEGETIGL